MQRESDVVHSAENHQITIGENIGTNFAYLNLWLNDEISNYSGLNYILVNLTKENLLKLKEQINKVLPMFDMEKHMQ